MFIPSVMTKLLNGRKTLFNIWRLSCIKCTACNCITYSTTSVVELTFMLVRKYSGTLMMEFTHLQADQKCMPHIWSPWNTIHTCSFLQTVLLHVLFERIMHTYPKHAIGSRKSDSRSHDLLVICIFFYYSSISLRAMLLRIFDRCWGPVSLFPLFCAGPRPVPRPWRVVVHRGFLLRVTKWLYYLI